VLLKEKPKPLLMRRSPARGPDTLTPTPISNPAQSPMGPPTALHSTLEPQAVQKPQRSPVAAPKIPPAVPPPTPVTPPVSVSQPPAPVEPPPRPTPPPVAVSLARPSAPPTPPPAPPPQLEDEGPLCIAPPPPGPGHEQRVRTPAGRDLRLSTVAMRAPKQHTGAPLPISSIPGLLPAPVSLVVHGTTLLAELAGPPIGRGRDRPSLYQDAFAPNTRCESYTLLPSTPAASFDIGHRRAAVQRIFYASTIALSPGGETLRLAIPELKVEILGQEPLLRLCVLHVTDAESGLVHVVCVLITP
jgi:hypothetical protein